MSAGILNLRCEQWAEFFRTITVSTKDSATLKDLTASVISGQIRKTAQSPVLVSFLVTKSETIGEFTISLTSDQTGALISSGEVWSDTVSLVYDIKIDDDRLLNGIFYVSPGVTHE